MKPGACSRVAAPSRTWSQQRWLHKERGRGAGGRSHRTALSSSFESRFGKRTDVNSRKLIEPVTEINKGVYQHCVTPGIPKEVQVLKDELFET